MLKPNKGALGIAVIYIILGSLWILFSDQLVRLISVDSKTVTWLSTIKGWFFVACTGWMLYSLITSLISEVDLAKNDLERKVEDRTQELVSMNEELMAMNEEIMVMNGKINQAKEEADLANQAKSEFLAKMSHEIRTPLNAIVGLNYLMQKTQLSEKQKEYIGKIILSANNLQVIINDILDFSKIEANKVILENIDFDLYEVLNNISNIISVRMSEKRLRLHFSVDARAPQVLKGDSFRLQQVLLNLTNNAVKFTDEGEISVSVVMLYEDSNYVRLKFTVQDTGIGIPAEKRDELFQAFSQMDTSTTRKYGGTGLGLAISKSLVELMGGTIEVVSGVGQGSSFSFALSFEYRRDFKFVENITANLKFLRILLISDNKEIQSVLKSQLEQFGFICHAINSASEALESIGRKLKYDLIFINQKMGSSDGIETAARIRKETGLAVPIIMLVSAYRGGELQTQIAADSAGINGILDYPVGQSRLYNEIVGLFEGVLTGGKDRKSDIDGHNRFMALKHTRVLLVEDNEINQQVAKDILEDEGIVVDIAEDGSQAVALVAREQYDIVLMDIQMPVMDGYEAARRIRELPHTQELPIIALTADIVKGVRDKAFAAGMNGYITKPIEPMQLLSTLKRLLHKETVSGTRFSDDHGRAQAVSRPIRDLSYSDSGSCLPEQLPGLNIKDGLGRINGKMKKYLELLRLFKDKQLMTASQISSALEENNINAAIRLAHTLKGSAGNIGANDVLKTAAQIEQGLKENTDPIKIGNQLQLLAAELKVINKSIEVISRSPGKEDTDLPLNRQKLEKQLQTLVYLVSVNQVEAVDAFKEMLPALKQCYSQAVLDKLSGAISSFDWTLAGGLLHDLCKEKPQENNNYNGTGGGSGELQ